MNLYLHFDKNGNYVGADQVGAARQADIGTDTVWVYDESGTMVNNVTFSFQKMDGTIVEVNYNQHETQEIEYDADNDLKYFEYYTEYEMYGYAFTSADNLLINTDWLKLTVNLMNESDQSYAQAEVLITVESSVMAQPVNLNWTEYQYLLQTYGSATLNEQTGADMTEIIDTLVDTYCSTCRTDLVTYIDEQLEQASVVGINAGTSTEILALTENMGIYLATDDEHFYNWDSDTGSYVQGPLAFDGSTVVLYDNLDSLNYSLISDGNDRSIGSSEHSWFFGFFDYIVLDGTNLATTLDTFATKTTTDAIIDGTQSVGNSLLLGGYSPDHFAIANSVGETKIPYTNFVLVSGAISAAGNTSDNLARARSENAVAVSADSKVEILDSDYLVNVALFTGSTIDSTTFISTPNLYSTEYTVISDTYLAFTIKRVDETDIDVSSIELSDILKISKIEETGISRDYENTENDFNETNTFNGDTYLLGNVYYTKDIDYIGNYSLVYSSAISAAGNVSTNTARVRSALASLVISGTKFKILDSDYLINIIVFSDTEINSTNFVSTPDSYETSHTVVEDGYIAFTIKRVDETDIATDSIILSDILSVEYSPAEIKESNNKRNFIHISFDDVRYCIQNLTSNEDSLNSVFDEPFLGKLKDLHYTYGAVFSLYLFDSTNLDLISNKFSKELTEASDWLKFAMHLGRNTTVKDGFSPADYNLFIENIFRIAGGINSVDRIPRLDRFQGTLEEIQGLRDSNCGIYGLLSTDDSRSSYYLNENENEYLTNHTKYLDVKNGITFYSTNMRLDWFIPGFTSTYTYNIPVESNPYDELAYRYGLSTMNDTYSDIITFTHEWQVYSSSYALNEYIDLVEQVCKFGRDYNYAFNFPQNKTDNISSLPTYLENNLYNQDTEEISIAFTDILAGANKYFEYDTGTNILKPKSNVDFSNKHFTFTSVEPSQNYTIYVEPNGTQPVNITINHTVEFPTYHYTIYLRDYSKNNRLRIIESSGSLLRYDTSALSTTEKFRISANVNADSPIHSIIL